MLPMEDDIDVTRKFSLEDKIESDKFTPCYVKEMVGHDLTLAYVQKHGFNTPILVREKAGLGIRVPSPDFSVGHVKMCVGSRRLLDVVDVSTQENMEMTMKEWCRYYNDPEKDRLLNVISLEFSHTKLEEYVNSPTIVRQIDWVDCAWPSHLKAAQKEATNSMNEMMYPKVQKYCLMSVKGCYTDFHIDLGGTSVWYHILRGQKTFWLIPPTEKNLLDFESWVLSGKQSDIFFGDMVEKCARLTLQAGHTFFIPSGWIHAVFTPQDSLVFGGNFLHSFAIERQLQIAKVEDTTRVPRKYRYPFMTEMLWYVLSKYVLVLLGRNHLETPSAAPDDSNHIHLTPQELHGLKAIVKYLHQLSPCRKNIPDLIKDPIALIKDVRTVVEFHRRDIPEMSVTGRSVLSGVDDIDVRPRERLHKDQAMAQYGYGGGGHDVKYLSRGVMHRGGQGGGPRRRRTRCKKCEACQRSDCGECTFCLDMIKFGGTGRAKQTCVTRQCLQPMLPVTAACSSCGLDGWGQQPMIPIQKAPRDTPSSLMECSVCYDIAHPDCYSKNYPDVSGVLNSDMPNSWECPRCCKDGRNRAYRPRHFRARQKSSEVRQLSYNSDTGAPVEIKSDDDMDSDTDGSLDGSPSPDSKRMKMEIKSDRSSPSNGRPISSSDFSKRSSIDPRKHSSSRTQSALQAMWHNNKVLKRPPFVVRPASDRPYQSQDGNPALERAVMVPVFRLLRPFELTQCALVCRAWARFSLDPTLWKRMDFSHKRLTAAHLAGIVRRQPEMLILDWSNIGKKQLGWLINRLPQLRGVSAQGCSADTVSALCTCVCPPLHHLNLSFVGGLNDSTLRCILSPPTDSRPGLTDAKSRLEHLRSLKVAGCDISDVSLRYVTQHLPRLTELDLSSCARITDAGVAQLATPTAPTLRNLTVLNLANLRGISTISLDHLSRCKALRELNITHTPLISNDAVEAFKEKSNPAMAILGKP